MAQGALKVFGVVGWKNNGKTTLVERLVAHLTEAGYRVSTVKHAHHEVDLDQPGKDSWRHREAGAREVVLATARRWAVIHELRGQPEPPLDELLGRMDRSIWSWSRASSASRTLSSRPIGASVAHRCWHARTRPSSPSPATCPCPIWICRGSTSTTWPAIARFILAHLAIAPPP